MSQKDESLTEDPSRLEDDVCSNYTGSIGTSCHEYTSDSGAALQCDEDDAVVEYDPRQALKVPLYPGSTVTLAQTAAFLLEICKVDRTTPNEHVDQLCQLLHGLLP